MTDPFKHSNSAIPSILSANGRLGRLSYAAWTVMSVLFLGFFILITFIISSSVFKTDFLSDQFDITSTHSIAQFILITLLSGVIIYITVILGIKRLHDLDKVGWIFLLNFVPVVSFFFMFYLMYAKGSKESNRYGPIRPTKTWEKIIGWPVLILPIIAGLGFIVAFVYGIAMPKSVTKLSEETIYIEQKIASEPISNLINPS